MGQRCGASHQSSSTLKLQHFTVYIHWPKSLPKSMFCLEPAAQVACESEQPPPWSGSQQFSAQFEPVQPAAQ